MRPSRNPQERRLSRGAIYPDTGAFAHSHTAVRMGSHIRGQSRALITQGTNLEIAAMDYRAETTADMMQQVSRFFLTDATLKGVGPQLSFSAGIQRIVESAQRLIL